MLQRFKTPPPDSPLTPFTWRMVLSIYGAYVVLCLVIIAFHIASHHYVAIYFLLLSMLSGWVILHDLWTGVQRALGMKLQYKKSPVGFWVGELPVLAAGVMMMFYLGSGWFIQLHWASH